MSKGPDTASAVQSEGQRGLQTVKTLNTEINTNKTQDEFYELEPVEVLEVYLDGPEIGGKKFPFLPRIGSKIDYTFVGGIKGTKELEDWVNQEKAIMAFSLFPTSMKDLFDVADAGKLMPPKSTWFEPKLRSGLLVNIFE